jgi:hypothetical protein
MYQKNTTDILWYCTTMWAKNIACILPQNTEHNIDRVGPTVENSSSVQNISGCLIPVNNFVLLTS